MASSTQRASSPGLLQAINLLERQVCNCMDTQGRPATGKKVKHLCLRCELLDLLMPDCDEPPPGQMSLIGS